MGTRDYLQIVGAARESDHTKPVGNRVLHRKSSKETKQGLRVKALNPWRLLQSLFTFRVKIEAWKQ